MDMDEVLEAFLLKSNEGRFLESGGDGGCCCRWVVVDFKVDNEVDGGLFFAAKNQFPLCEFPLSKEAASSCLYRV